MDSFTQNSCFEKQQKQFFATQEEKRAVRRTAWAVCIPGMVFFLVTEFWASILLMIGGRFGIAGDKIISALKDPALLQILQIALSLLLLTVPFILCAKISGASISEITVLKKPKSENNLAFFLFGIGFCAFANIAVNSAGRILERFGIRFSMPKSEDPQGIFGFLLVVLSTAVVPALVEEFAYRGIVFGMLKPFGEAFAIFGSAAAFGVLHGNFEQIPFALLVGLVLGFIRVKTDSLVICMSVHAVNNLTAVILSYCDGLSAVFVNIIYTVYIMLALTLAILGVALLKNKGNFSFKPSNTAGTVKSLYVNFFFSPAFIIFFLMFLLRAVVYFFEY